MYSIKSYTNSLNELPVNISTHLFDSLVRPILTYNCEIWNRDVYKPYFNATERARKNNFNVDQMQFIEKTPYDKIYNKLCKFFLESNFFSSNCSARYKLVRYPIYYFIKTQSLLYEDRLLAVDTPETIKECFSLSMSP